MIDLKALASNLRTQAATNSTIILDDTVLPNTVLDAIRTAFALAAEANLTVTGLGAADIPDPVNDVLTISAGTASLLNQSGVAISLMFTASANSLEAVITATMSPSWKFSDSFSGLNIFPFDELNTPNTRFVYATAPQPVYEWPGEPSYKIALEPGLSFLSDVTLANFSVLSTLVGKLLGTTPIKFYGPFGPRTGQPLPIGAITARLGSGTFGVGVAPNALTLSNPAVTVRVGAADEENPLQAVDLMVVADFNKTLEVAVDIPMSGGTLAISTTPLPNHSSINSLIESLPGGSGFAHYIPSELSQIFANVGLDNFTMIVDPSPKVTYLALSISTLQRWPLIADELVLEGLNLRIEVVDPTGLNWKMIQIEAKAKLLPNLFSGDFDFTIGLQQQTTWEVNTISGAYYGAVSLGAIVGELLGNQDSAPQVLRAIEFVDFGVNAIRSAPDLPFTYTIYGSVETVISLLDRQFLAHLGLVVNKPPTGYQILLSGQLVIGEELFSLTLDVESGDSTLNAQWRAADGALALEDMGSAFGFNLPALPAGLDPALSSVSFAYDFTQNTFALEAVSANYRDTAPAAFMPVGHRGLTITDLQFALHKDAAGFGGEIACGLRIADIAFRVQASHPAPGQGWHFVGTTSAGQPISLTALFSGLLELFDLSVPSSVPTISLSNLSVEFDTLNERFAFHGETAAEIEVPFVVGNQSKIHALVDLVSAIDPATGKRQLSGLMEGDLHIGSALFTLQYALAKEAHIFKASWESTQPGDYLGFNTLLEALGISHDLEIPANLDLNLKKVYVEYQVERETLTLVADSATYGEAFFISSTLPLGAPEGGSAPAVEGQRQFVFGLEYVGVNKLSQIPVLGRSLGSTDLFAFEELGILIASADFKTFTVPQLPPLTTLTPAQNSQPAVGAGGAAARKPIAVDTTLKLQKGISFVGVLALDQGEESGQVQALRQVIPQSQLVVTAAYSASQESFTLRAVLEGSVDIPTGGSSDLKISNAGLEFIFADGITFELYGALVMHFDHQTIDITPRIAISAEEAEVLVDVDFEDGWQAPMGIEGLTLDEVAFALGVNFIPAPGVNLGLEGKAHIANQPRASDEFAFVLEIIEELPNPLLLSFYLEELDIQTALAVFAPRVDASFLPNFIKEIKATQLSFSWADSVVILPDGSVAQPGLYFSGNVEFLSFSAHASLALNQIVGLAGDFELSPIHIQHILDVTGHGKGVYLNMRNGAPVRQKALPDKDTSGIERVEIVPPGGAVLQFRTTQSPYLFASLLVTFLDLAHAEVEALVTEQGVLFKLLYNISDVVKAELDFTLSKQGFHLYSQFGLHLQADIGPIIILGVDFGTIHLDAGFDLELQIDATLEEFSLGVWGDFEFEGARLTLPKLHLSVAPASLADLPEQIVQHIQNNAEEIFKDLFDEAKKFFEDAGKEIAQVAEETGQEIAKIGEEATQKAQQIVQAAEQAVEHTAEEIAQGIQTVEDEAEAIAHKAAEEVEQIGKAAVAEVEKIGTEIEHVAQEAEHEIQAIGEEIAQEAEAVGKEIEQVASAALHEVEEIGKAAEEEAAKILSDARQLTQHILDAARSVVDALEREAAALWDEVKDLAEKAKEALESAGHAVENVAKKAWHAIKKY